MKEPLHEYFSEYTADEIIHIQNTVCKKNNCKYLRTRKTGGLTYCDYLCTTGKMRDCMPDLCTHYNDDIKFKKKNTIDNLFDNTTNRNNKETSKKIKKRKSTKKKSASTKTRTKNKRRNLTRNLKSDVS